MKPLRFCFFTTFYPPQSFGGDGIGVQRLARALVRRGHHVTVVHDLDAYRVLGGRDPRADRAEVSGNARDGVVDVGLESRLGHLSPLLTQQTGRPVIHRRRLVRLLEEGRFDAINYHNVSLVGGPGLLGLGDAFKLYWAHEHWLVCPTHVLWRYDREPCPERDCFRCVIQHRRPPQLWRYTGALERELKHVHLFLAFSEFSRRKHQEFAFPREMEVLPGFLPDDALPAGSVVESVPELAATSGGGGACRQYFLFVGRLEKMKGLQDALPLFQGTEGPFLLVAGEGNWGDELRRQAAGLARVRFLGRVEPEGLRHLYRDALALVVPTLGYETFGHVLIEAFREGTPVVARRIGALPELVEQCGGGILFESGEELGRAMAMITHDPGLRDELGRNARAGFVSRWREDVVVKRYVERVREGIKRRAAGKRTSAAVGASPD